MAVDQGKAREILKEERLVEYRITCIKEELSSMDADDPERAELVKQLKRLQKRRRGVRQTLEVLSLEEGELLRLYYIRRMPLPYIYRKLSISRATFYRLRKKAVENFAAAFSYIS